MLASLYVSPLAIAALGLHCGNQTPAPKDTSQVNTSRGSEVDTQTTVADVDGGSAEDPEPQGHDTEKEADHATRRWTYVASEAQGPEGWGNISGDFAACKTGTSQAPVDLSMKAEKGKDLKPLAFAYVPMALQIHNNGHTVQVTNGAAASFTVGGEKFDLVEFHFHSPSEHTIDGAKADMEVHFVHKNAKGELAVVAVLFKKGKENTALKAVFENAPEKRSREPTAVAGVTIDVSSMLPAKAGYFSYAGSLTTPPCSEGVRWFVLTKSSEVSEAQIAKLRDVTHGDTNRPVQPLGTRKVQQFKP